jgi:microcompartment protein CcmL/EutN
MTAPVLPGGAAAVPESLAVFDIADVASGYAAIDAIDKRAHVVIEGAGPIEPGRFLLLVSGAIAEIEQAWAAVASGEIAASVVDGCCIWQVHPLLWAGLGGARNAPTDAIGIVDGATVSSTLAACDLALKEARVGLVGVRLAVGLGGRSHFAISGAHADVAASVDAAERSLGPRGGRARVVGRAGAALVGSLLMTPSFALRGA